MLSRMEEELVVLVDQDDNQHGVAKKMEAHEKGLLHRAFSVFVFNSKGELLLQKRAAGKYHSPGLWTNTCCSHPRVGEKVEDAASRRLLEEMGMDCALSKTFSFVYRAELENNLIEHEFDHVFIGVTDDEPKMNPEEVQDFKYLTVAEVTALLAFNPETFTSWFGICWHSVVGCLEANAPGK